MLTRGCKLPKNSAAETKRRCFARSMFPLLFFFFFLFSSPPPPTPSWHGDDSRIAAHHSFVAPVAVVVVGRLFVLQVQAETKDVQTLVLRNTTSDVLTWVASSVRQAQVKASVASTALLSCVAVQGMTTQVMNLNVHCFLQVSGSAGTYVANYPAFSFERQSGTIQAGCSLRCASPLSLSLSLSL